MRKTGGIPIRTVAGVGCLLAAFGVVLVLFRFLPSQPVASSGNGSDDGSAAGAPTSAAVGGATEPQVVIIPESPSIAVPALRTGNIVDVSQEPTMAGLTATPVTVDFRDLSLPAACDALSGAAKIQVEMNPSLFQLGNIPSVTLHLKDAPFLEGLLELRDQSGGQVSVDPSLRRVLIGAIRPNTGIGKWCVSGPVAFVIRNMSRDADLSIGGPTRAMMFMEIVNEPAVNIVQTIPRPVVNAFTDEKNQGIKIGQVTTAGTQMLTIFFDPPANPGSRIAQFRGSVPMTIADKSESIRPNSLSETTNREVSGMKVQIEPLVPGPPRGTLPVFTTKIRYERAAMPEDQWAKMVPVISVLRPRVYSAENKLLGSPISITRESADRLVATVTATATPAIGNPDHLILEVPGVIREVLVPFEFKDLILP